MRGQGASGGIDRTKGVRGAVATVEDAGGRSGGCASEVGDFHDDGSRGADGGWSREAREKVNALGVL